MVQKAGDKLLLYKKQNSYSYGTKSRTQIVMVSKTGLRMLCYQSKNQIAMVQKNTGL